MTNVRKCEETVDPYPLMLSMRLPCSYRAKFTMNHSIYGDRHVCGVHRKVLLRAGWTEVAD